MVSAARTFCVVIVTYAVCMYAASAQGETSAYLEAGVPAPNRIWLGPEYARAAEVLTSSKIGLPRYDERAGRAVLERLTSMENFALANNHTIAVGSRVQDILMILDGTRAILNAYLAAATAGEKVNRELTRIYVFLLHISATLLPIVDEFAATIPDFENQPVRVQGRQRVHAGVATMFSGAQVTLSARDFYTDEDLSLLLQGMADTLPVLEKVFTSEFRKELQIKLNEDKARFSDSGDMANIERMLRELESE